MVNEEVMVLMVTTNRVAAIVIKSALVTIETAVTYENRMVSVMVTMLAATDVNIAVATKVTKAGATDEKETEETVVDLVASTNENKASAAMVRKVPDAASPAKVTSEMTSTRTLHSSCAVFTGVGMVGRAGHGIWVGILCRPTYHAYIGPGSCTTGTMAPIGTVCGCCGMIILFRVGKMPLRGLSAATGADASNYCVREVHISLIRCGGIPQSHQSVNAAHVKD